MFRPQNLSLHPFGRALAAVSLLLVPFLSALAADTSPSPSPTATTMTENPLLKESSLDFHYPPFDKIKNEHFAPAYEQGMAEQFKEIQPIASNPEPPTFENTIVAMEKTGELLGPGRSHFFQSLQRQHQSRPAKDRDGDGAEAVRASGRDLS